MVNGHYGKQLINLRNTNVSGVLNASEFTKQFGTRSAWPLRRGQNYINVLRKKSEGFRMFQNLKRPVRRKMVHGH